MSGWITLALVGVGVVVAAHHGEVRRDLYRDQADCARDWPQHSQDCQQRSHGGVRVSGPSYEAGYRPATARPDLRLESETVQRAGFGRSGARFSSAS